MSGKVLATIRPQTPWGEQEAPEERAAQAVLMATADFYIAIQQATTVTQALKLRSLIANVLASVESAERAALERADQLCN